MSGFLALRIVGLMLIVGRLDALHQQDNAPADLPKEAASFDLPIALDILVGSAQIEAGLLSQYAVVGELALEGTTWPTKGALFLALDLLVGDLYLCHNLGVERSSHS